MADWNSRFGLKTASNPCSAFASRHDRRITNQKIAGAIMGPLSGMKVLDLTHVMAGPTCTLMLADMGAEVIKVEKKPDGDDTRRTIPPKIGDEAAAFLMMNRNKRGIVLDLKTKGGAEILRRLAR